MLLVLNQYTHMWRFGATLILACLLLIAGHNKKRNKNSSPRKLNLILRSKYSIKPQYVKVLKNNYNAEKLCRAKWRPSATPAV